MNVCLFGSARSIHLRRLATGLTHRGVQVHVVTRRPAEVSGATVEEFRVPPVSLTNPRRWRGRWSNYLRQFVKRFDVVNIQLLWDWGFTPEMMERGCFIATPWGSDIVAPPEEDLPSSKLIDARVAMLRHANVVTAWAPRFAATVADYAGIEADSIALLPLGVDPALFSPATKSVERQAGDAHCVGSYKGFRAVYGPTCLIRAIPLILKELPTTRFELLGDGPKLDECKELAWQLGVAPSIEWVGPQPHDAIPGWLQRWSVSVIPSLCEAFGAAAVESSAMGVPVVASNVGGLPDSVRDGETGVLVPPNSPEALSAEIVALLKDDARRKKLAHAGREFALRHFDWNEILDRWVETLAIARDRSCVMV